MKNRLYALLGVVFFLVISTLVQAGGISPEEKAKAIDQLHQLMGHSLGRADNALQSEGNFVPYASVIRRDGVIKNIVLDKDKSLPAEKMVLILQESLKKLAQRGGIAASAIYYTGVNSAVDEEDVKILVVELEHSRGVALLRVTPYSKVDGKVAFGAPLETEAKLNVMKRPEQPSDVSEGK